MVAVAASTVSTNSASCCGSSISVGEVSRPVVRLRLPLHKSDSFYGDAKPLQLELLPAFIPAFEESDCWGDIGSEETICSSFGERVFSAGAQQVFPRASSVC